MGDVSSIPGTLEVGDQRHAVSLSKGTRLCPTVRFATAPPATGALFDRLVVHGVPRPERPEAGRETGAASSPSAPLILSRCRFDAGGPSESHGQLVFLDDVYDFDALFGGGRLLDVLAAMHKLPLLLSQRDEVTPVFKAYVSDLLYGMSVYEKFFNEQDRIYASTEDPIATAAAQAVLLKTEGPGFLRYFDAELSRLEALVAGLHRESYERHGTYFRRVMWDFILGSEFMKRTNLRPRGYAGDAEMMQMIYEHAHRGRYCFNKLLHLHPISTPAAQAVRNRRALIARTMDAVAGRSPLDRLRFFSVACGPAWELRDVFRDEQHVRRWQGLLLDQDVEALAAARAGLEQIGAVAGPRPSVEYLHDSVRTMLRTHDLSKRLGRFHFIYSMGLFDYLTPPVARAVLARLYGVLEVGGTLVLGNYHVAQPTRHYMAFWMDWVLYLRSEEDMMALADGLPGARASLELDETRCQMFLKVEKLA